MMKLFQGTIMKVVVIHKSHLLWKYLDICPVAPLEYIAFFTHKHIAYYRKNVSHFGWPLSPNSRNCKIKNLTTLLDINRGVN